MLVSGRSRCPARRACARFAICKLPNLRDILVTCFLFHILLVFRIFRGHFYTCSYNFVWCILCDSIYSLCFVQCSHNWFLPASYYKFLFSFRFNSYLKFFIFHSVIPLSNLYIQPTNHHSYFRHPDILSILLHGSFRRQKFCHMAFRLTFLFSFLSLLLLFPFHWLYYSITLLDLYPLNYLYL